jgi:hypothetical protein
MREFAAAKDCPLAPPARSSVHARTLHRACLILGGVDALAKHLDIAATELRGWLEGKGAPSERVFLSAVEIVLLHAEELGPSN